MERFLFASANPKIVALFRIALAAMLMLSFQSRIMRPDPMLHRVPGLFELYGQVFLTRPYWLLILILLIAFGVGWRPRVLGSLLFAILLPLDFLGGSQQSRQILLFSLLSFSFLRSDAWLSLKQFSWESFRYKPDYQLASAGPMWPIRLIQLQLSVTYGINALAKTTPEYLSGQTLIGMSQRLPNFLVDLSDGYLHLPWLALPVALLAVASVATEYFLAVGFWFRRSRFVAAGVGFLFHFILKMVIRIYMLDWATMFLYLSFLLPFESTDEEVTPQGNR
jgi:hypothetical protein